MSAALSLATAISLITQDINMDTVVETPVKPERNEGLLLVNIERAAIWLASRSIAYDAIRLMDNDYPGLVASDRRQFQGALDNMIEAIEAYRNV